MYRYMYVKAKVNRMFNDSEHRALIDKYAEKGWRFVAAVPSASGVYGQITEVDLVFEKEE